MVRIVRKSTTSKFPMFLFVSSLLLPLVGYSQGDRVDSLIALLQSRNFETQKEAIRGLAWIGDSRAVLPIEKLLDEDDIRIRREATRALGAIGDTSATERILALMNDADTAVILDAIIALGVLKDKRAVEPLVIRLRSEDRIEQTSGRSLIEIGDAAVPILIKALSNQKWNVQYPAEAVLRDMKSIKVETLIAALHDDSSRTRRIAANLLGRTKCKRALGPLIDVLQDSVAFVRFNAVIALGTINDIQAVEPLIQSLKDSDPDVRTYAIQSLASYKDERSVIPFMGCLNDENSYARSEAFKALKAFADPRTIDSLIPFLRDSYVRSEAEEVLAAIGRPAVKPLLEAFRDCKYYDTKIGIISTLGEIGGPLALRKLAEIADSQVYSFSATQALGKIGKPAVGELINLMNAKEPFVREEAIEALGRIGDKRAVQPLVEIIQKKDSSTLIPAVKALKALDSSEAFPFLLSMLEYPDSNVRAFAAWELRDMNDSRAVDPLISLLENDDSWIVRRNATWSLGDIGDKCATPKLINAFKNPGKYYVIAVEDALIRIDDTTAVPDMINELGGNNAGYAARVLGHLKDKRAVEPLINALKSGGRFTKEEAIKALGQLGDKKAVEPLIAELSDSNARIRNEACNALVDLGIQSVEPLIEALETEDTLIVKQSVGILGRIKDRRAIEPLITQIHGSIKGIRWESAVALLNFKCEQHSQETFVALLDDEFPCMRGLAAMALWHCEEVDPQSIKYLIYALTDGECRFNQDNAWTALKMITREDFLYDYRTWRNWWEKNKRSFK